MSEFSTANYNINRFDKTAGVPTAQVDKQGEMQTANKWKQIADGIGMFADKGGEAYAAKINRDRRDEAEARRKEIEARQEKNRKENEARIEAERLNALYGDKNWQELSEAEKEEKYVFPPTKEEQTRKRSILTKDQKDNKYLKEAYQQKRTEGSLKKHQAEWDAVAPNLVDRVVKRWREQKNNPDGEKDLTKFATAKLEVYKLERAEEDLIGLPQLGKALQRVPLNDNTFLSMVAKRKQEYIDEQEDRSIQAGIDTFTNDDLEGFDLSTPEKIDGLIEHISAVPLPGFPNEKARLPNGEVMRAHSREKVQLQVIDDVNNKVMNATSSDDPVFKVIKAFTGTNAKDGRIMYERTGVGDHWKTAVSGAMKKKAALIKSEKEVTSASNKIIIKKAKESSHGTLINVSSALDYQTIAPEHESEGIKLDENGKAVGVPNKLQQLLIAKTNLEANKDDFATASMSEKYNEMRGNLVAAINKLDPNHKEFDISNNPVATNMKKDFIKQLAELDVEQVQAIRKSVHQNLNQTPAIVAMKHAAIKVRMDELDEERETLKDQQTIIKNEQQIEKQNIEKTSSGKTRTYRAEIRDSSGKILSSDKLLEKLRTIEKDKGLTDANSSTLSQLYNTQIKEQQKKEHIKKDTTKHSSLFTKITSKGIDGKLKTPEEWNNLETELNSHKWIEGSPQKTQLLNLISAGKNKTGDFDRQVAELKKENAYRTKLSNKLKPVEKNLADIIAKVSLPEGVEGRITVETALGNLQTARDNFDNNFEGIIKEGGDLGINIDHDDRFEDAYAEILGQRTEKEISDVKKKWIQEHEKNEISREEFKTEQLTSIRELIENPLVNKEGERIEPSEALANIQAIFSESTHKTTSTEVGVSLEDSNVFSPDDQNKHIRKLQVSIKEKSDPSKFVTKGSVISESYTLQQEAAELSGEDRWLKLEENIELIEQEFLLGNLSKPDFDKERGIIKQLQNDGKVKTKPAFHAGENHIKSLFAGYLTKFNNNKMFLPVNEDGKLYDTLVQDFNFAWAGLAPKLHNATEQERIAAAVELARSYTKVYANDTDHPIDAETNQRLKEYQMNPLALMKLRKAQAVEKRKKEVKESSKNRQGGTDTNKKKQPTKLSEEAENSEINQALENDMTSYIINPAAGTISVVTTAHENPQGWLSITKDKIFDGLWNDKKETYVTISEPYDMATL